MAVKNAFRKLPNNFIKDMSSINYEPCVGTSSNYFFISPEVKMHIIIFSIKYKLTDENLKFYVRSTLQMHCENSLSKGRMQVIEQ